ncbi:D-2-hydroxyacid dehydrogenase [Ferrimonas aestuarii]|uniref:D-2-hydroxyacid dehydrogenase n=1 Tax=Ferrimonas aestuarii TaxID=2569539 RepID=A0A4U1BL33_9GAMM|nr:D-2-hydroxyacid dehydrogenase [Ferrimonas aestuarii]TKB53633.1 D-2-hydroxyacid dehydrogenase [Ferrimonas aestuarii]
MTTLALLTQDNQSYRERLTSLALPQLELIDAPQHADIWLADPNLAAEQLQQLPPPKWLACTYAGVNALLNAKLPQGYQLTHIKGVFGQPMAEYLFGTLLSYRRRLQDYHLQQQQRLWQAHGYQSLEGQTMVILGTGDIGQILAKLARAFGMNTLGVSQSGRANNQFDQVLSADQLLHALPRADVLVSILPNTEATNNLLNHQTLSLLPANSVLINVGRGNVVDEAALIDALDHHQLAHAILDVFNEEPLPSAHPFWSHPNITITPHVAAVSQPGIIVRQFAHNYEKFIKNQNLDNLFDWRKGY